jgi:curved DNA-binding protein CbpA
MPLKNYYKILDVTQTASQEEIKKAYRQLAFRYHPDKNNGDRIAEIYFKEIQEAYYTLSDQQRRTTYNQKRWYSNHSLRKESPEPLTAFKLFTKSNELMLYLQQLRHADVNKKPLFNYIRHLLSDHALQVLKLSNDRLMNKEIILRLLEASQSLSAFDKEQVAIRLKPISDKDSLPLIEQRLKETRRAKVWERYQFLIVLFITILLCWLIYHAGG